MILALSTHWNAARHRDGEAIIEEILELGVRHVELGFDLTMEQAAGVRRLVEQGAVVVTSVHNYCPVPLGAPAASPELFTFTHPDRRVRESAARHTEATARFAAELGAKAVVIHAGRVDTRVRTCDLLDLWERGRQEEPVYEKTKLRLLAERDRRIGQQVDYLREKLERLLPILESLNLQLGIENLPAWEAIPTEVEVERLLRAMNSPRLRYWHDVGHGQIRENLGFINHHRWLERLRPFLCGVHIHDVMPPAADHLLPPMGHVRFDLLRPILQDDVIRVVEPSPGMPAEEVLEGLRRLRETLAPLSDRSTTTEGVPY